MREQGHGDLLIWSSTSRDGAKVYGAACRYHGCTFDTGWLADHDEVNRLAREHAEAFAACRAPDASGLHRCDRPKGHRDEHGLTLAWPR